MDNILIVVDDLEAARAFFVELGMELEGETTVEGPAVDRMIGLQGVRATLVVLRTPDGHAARGNTPPLPGPKLTGTRPGMQYLTSSS
jgi:catechol 2,3-dioxygenase-like lactoylglutathione lyase family enzyme